MGSGIAGIIMSVKIDDLTITYDHHPAIHHLNAEIQNGDWLAVVGPNGAGKSTLLNALAGEITEYEGTIEGLCANKIAYLPQQSQLDKSFPITVYDLVTTGLWEKIGFTRGITKQQKKICESALYAVGLEGFEDRLIGTLSGGQLQRTLFARVLVQDQKVILLDEPFNAIDTATLLDLTKIIQHWNKIERTVIMVTHDLEYVKEYCPKSLLLARECIDIGNTKTVLSNTNLKRARELSEAFDNHATWCME